jgi:hypothetical protein
MNGKPTSPISSQIYGWSRILLGIAFLAVLAIGCEAEPPPVKPASGPDTTSKKTPMGRNVFLVVPKDGGQRRVVVNAYVVDREGQLEGFLTRKNSKEHEYILAADCEAKDIHTALLAAGAEPGSPVRFARDSYTPASGDVIKVTVQYTDKNGKHFSMPAQNWIRNAVKKNAMEHQWVFAGSRLIPDPDGKMKPFYAADNGDLICVCNMPSAMMDLPVKNPNSEPESRIYEAFTERIPPLGTKVEVVLELLEKKKEPNKDANKDGNKDKEQSEKKEQPEKKDPAEKKDSSGPSNDKPE